MKLLLDSHYLLWLLTDSPKLGAAARELIADAESVWFSDATIWELGLKWRKGRIAIEPRRLAQHALANGLRPLSIHVEALLLSSEIQQQHGDPFDRLLYAQAKCSDIKLLTADAALAEFGSAAVKL